MSTNGSSKAGTNRANQLGWVDTSIIVNSPGFRSMVESIHASNKLAPQHPTMVAAAERQVAPAREMIRLAAAANADPVLKAFESTFKLAQDQSRLLVSLEGIQAAIKSVSPEQLGLPPGWTTLLDTVSLPTLDPSLVERLLAESDELAEELEADDVAQSVQEFFENQPELAESIDNLPVVRAALNQADRDKIVAFIRVLIFISAFCLILGVTTISPLVGAILGSIGGLGAKDAYGKSEVPVRRLVDRMAEDEHGGEIKDPLWED